MARPLDLTGQKYGRLLALRSVGTHPNRNKLWLCQCDCGAEHIVETTKLRNGNTQSCGCKLRDHMKTIPKRQPRHGDTVGGKHSPEWVAWRSMKRRCDYPNSANYSAYGGRGIRVCDRWRDSYEAFLSDMGRRPSDQHSLDRIDVNGNYEPENCRWSTAKEQMANVRNNRIVTVRGETMILAEAIRRFSARSKGSVSARLSRGWTVEQALGLAKREDGRHPRP